MTTLFLIAFFVALVASCVLCGILAILLFVQVAWILWWAVAMAWGVFGRRSR